MAAVIAAALIRPSEAVVSEPDVAVQGVTLRYPTANGPVTALEDISFTIAPEKFVGLIGPSGCGKSSLLMILAGLAQPSAGRILVRGKELRKPDPSRIGVVFQDASLLPWKTALGNIEFPLKLRGVPAAKRRERARALLELVDLRGFGDHHPHELSGGMRQRVSIARGLCQDPDILLMDEPFAALDEQTRMTMGNELLQIWGRYRKTVVFVTHSLTEAVYLCDEVLIMSRRPGRIIERLAIDLPRPRTYDMMATETFGRLRNHIWQIIRKD